MTKVIKVFEKVITSNTPEEVFNSMEEVKKSKVKEGITSNGIIFKIKKNIIFLM